MAMPVHDLWRWQFSFIPHLAAGTEIKCSGLVILPNRQKHDSGYRCMAFVLLKDNQRPIGIVAGCSDVIHLDGIGGYGYQWLKRFGKWPDSIPPRAWEIDCLPRSGLLRLWARSDRSKGIVAETCGRSSFEVFAQ